MKHILFCLLMMVNFHFLCWEHSYGQVKYAVIDLGTLGGSSGVTAAGINDSGMVVGSYVHLPEGPRAFLYRNGSMSDLGTLGGSSSGAEAINDSGAVTGWAPQFQDSSYHAFLYRNGVFSDLGALESSNYTFGYGINNSGSVVGQAGVHIPAGAAYHAFLYRNGVMSDLGTFGGPFSSASGINDSGAVVGYATTGGGSGHAFLYRNGVMSDLGTLGGTLSKASGINNSGSIVGLATTGGGSTHAFLHRNGVMSDLGTLGSAASVAYGINDSGTIVGQAGLAFVYRNGVMTDLNAMTDTTGGWLLNSAVAINNKGEIVGNGIHNGQTRAFLLEPAQITISRPRAGERWIAGEQDTIRWTGGQAGKFLNIEFSVDSGITFTLVDFAIPADSGLYIWTVPDSLSTRAKIRLSDLFTSNVLVVGDTFRVKGYVLTRMTPEGHYEAFKPNTHGWSYLNGTLWPQSWWSQFHYSTATDPYTNSTYPPFFHLLSDSTFVDWPLWVDVFSTSACYWSTFLGIYDGAAQQKWRRHTDPHQGSCFGFAASSFLAFNFKNQFLARHPGIPNFTNLFSLPINNTIRSTINGYYAYQYGIQSFNNDVIGVSKDPRTTLQEIKNMFITDAVDIRTITIYNHNGLGGSLGGGAHTMAPIRIVKDNTGPSRYRLMLYNSNNPGSSNPYILIDSLNNTWTDFTGLGATWTGSNHFYLEIPVSNYLSTPVMGRGNSRPDNIKGSGNIEFYNTSKANVMYTASNGNRIGLVNGVVTDEMEDGIAIFDKNGRPSDPVGYFVPDDAYSIVLSNMVDTTGKAFLTAFKDNVVYDYTRGNVNPSQVDRFRVNDGFSVASQDAAEKQINLQVIAELDSSERMFFVNNTQLRQNDSLCLRELGQSNLLMRNYGTGKTYNLEINQRSSEGQEVFEHLSIQLQANSSHTILPNWDSLAASPVITWVDMDNNGTIDDTMIIVNQTTGVDGRGTLEMPKQYQLAQNYPNPFNPITRIEFALPQENSVKLTVYNVLGQLVKTLVDEQRPAGRFSAEWDGTGTNGLKVSSGVYFYRLEAKPSNGTAIFVSMKKMLLLR